MRYYIDSQGLSNINFNKKIIELINKDENAKEAQMYFLKFLNNKIKFDYNLD
jgi:RecJ-like exonuclease